VIAALTGTLMAPSSGVTAVTAGGPGAIATLLLTPRIGSDPEHPTAKVHTRIARQGAKWRRHPWSSFISLPLQQPGNDDCDQATIATFPLLYQRYDPAVNGVICVERSIARRKETLQCDTEPMRNTASRAPRICELRYEAYSKKYLFPRQQV
jgi:hypothetical protein